MRNIMIWSSHNFAHAMIVERSWHVQTSHNYNLIVTLDSKLKFKKITQDFNYELINLSWNVPLGDYIPQVSGELIIYHC